MRLLQRRRSRAKMQREDALPVAESQLYFSDTNAGTPVTDQIQTNAPQTDAPQLDAQPDASRVRRGRPRPQNTLQLDETVIAKLQARGPMTRAQLEAELPQVKGSIVYIALCRLKRDGRVERRNVNGARNIWALR